MSALVLPEEVCRPRERAVNPKRSKVRVGLHVTRNLVLDAEVDFLPVARGQIGHEQFAQRDVHNTNAGEFHFDCRLLVPGCFLAFFLPPLEVVPAVLVQHHRYLRHIQPQQVKMELAGAEGGGIVLDIQFGHIQADRASKFRRIVKLEALDRHCRRKQPDMDGELTLTSMPVCGRAAG
jgi:hypothetical protein